MVTLWCAVVGGSAFDVTIDASESVNGLKNAIKAKKENDLKAIDADKLQLYLAKKGDKWLTENEVKVVSDTEGLKHLDVARAKLRRVGLSDAQVGEVGEEEEAAGNGPVNVLVVVPAEASPQMFPSYWPHADGINLQLPHLLREALVEKLYNTIVLTDFVLISAPAGSGKTSLLALFARRHPEIRYVPITFDDPKANATALLASHGVDVVQKTCRIPDGKLCVFMLDDCQRQYQDVAFWTGLIKGSSSYLPPHVRFIISATHLLETDAPESPIAFVSIPWKLTRDDFLISDEEAHQCINLENGLPPNFRFPTLLEVIIRECNGHIGSLRVSLDAIFEHFRKAVGPTEQDLLAYYLSGTYRNLQLFLIKCLVRDPTCGPLSMQLNEDENKCFTRLMKAGIVTRDGEGYVKFASPLAERYYSKWLFPSRGDENPTSLHELIRKVIGSMSATALRQSVAHKDTFPKEATFQHQFMAALALHTHPACYICPELSRVFPASPHQRDQRSNGEIDFYLNGSLQWGVELLVNGDKISEHMARFEANGKYAALATKDYAVIDLRGNKSGSITNVVRKPERITVFFKLGDFSSCRCIFGLAEDSDPIILNH